MTELGLLLPPAQLYIALAGTFTLISILLSKEIPPLTIWGVNFVKPMMYMTLSVSSLHVLILVLVEAYSAIIKNSPSANLIVHGITLSFLVILAFLFLYQSAGQVTANVRVEEAGSLET